MFSDIYGCMKVHEKLNISFSGAIISCLLLILICLFGVIGNSLVIIVYCFHTKINRSNVNNQKYSNYTEQAIASERWRKVTRPPVQHKHFNVSVKSNVLRQHKLILLLALVDLFTCIFILPVDILCVIYYKILDISWRDPHLGNVTLDHNNTTYITTGSVNSTYLLYDTLTCLRNIIFAIEGSVLAAIAIDRFMIVVYRGSSNTKPEGSTQTTQLMNSDLSTGDESNSIRPVPQVRPHCPSCIQCQNCKISNYLIWNIIILVAFITILLESVIFISHLINLNCWFIEQFREYVNQFYISNTLISFIIVAYLYIRIFMTVRKSDLTKQKWHRSMNKESKPQQQTSEPGESVTTLDHHNHQQQQQQQQRNYQFINAHSLINTIQSSDTGRDRSKQRKIITRSHRTGLMLCISTFVFYATLFPVLLVHFNWWSIENDNFTTTMTTTTSTTAITSSTDDSSMTSINTKFKTSHAIDSPTVHHEFYYINNAVNFFIYSLFNQNFRARLKNCLNLW